MPSSPPQAGKGGESDAAWWMSKKPCSVCRKWFTPDPRVGARQKVCSRPECQEKRRARSQASWRSRNPDYFRARYLRRRSNQAQAADEAQGKPLGPGEAALRRPPPIRVSGPLRQIPWDVVQDEIGFQTTDVIAVVAKLIVRVVQDQRRLQVTEDKGEPATLREPASQDQIRAVPG